MDLDYISSDLEVTYLGEKRMYDELDSDSDESEDTLVGVPRTKLNSPHDIAYVNWVKNWTMNEALRELVSNMIDRSKTVTIEEGLEGEIEIVEKPQSLIVQIGERKLAEATWKVNTCKYIREYSDTGVIKSCMTVAKHDAVKTQVTQLTNFDSSLPWDSFRNGKTTKGDDQAVIGKNGEGLGAASVVLTRLGCNISATCTSNRYQTTVGLLDEMVCFQIRRKKASTSAKPDQPLNSVRFRIVLNPYKGGLKMDVGALVAEIRLPSAVRAAGVATSRGILLLSEDYRGKQYNRDIFVTHSVHCLFGCDFFDPEKNLFLGRDRNSMKQQNLLAECGAILSEAILSTPEVCHRVLQALKYPPEYTPGESADDLPRYDDLKEGKHLSAEALQALRRAEILAQPTHLQQAVFCAHVPPALQAIIEHQGLRVVYTHPVLHNHEAVVEDFYGALRVNARSLSPDLRVGAHQQRIAELMGVGRVVHSGVPHVSGRCTFWRQGSVLYVTSPEHLGAASTIGFKEAQEVALYKTLLACKVEEEGVVRIMRLLREGHEHQSEPEDESEEAPLAAAKGGEEDGGESCDGKEGGGSFSQAKSTFTCASSDSSTRTFVAKPTYFASASTAFTSTQHRSAQTSPVLAHHAGLQTEDPPCPAVHCVSTGTDPHLPYPAHVHVPAPVFGPVPAPPAPLLTAHTATQTDAVAVDVAASTAAQEPPAGTYVRHAPSGVWLHGVSAQQQQGLAELIEDCVQTEEGQRRLRRLSGQLCLTASIGPRL